MVPLVKPGYIDDLSYGGMFGKFIEFSKARKVASDLQGAMVTLSI